MQRCQFDGWMPFVERAAEKLGVSPSIADHARSLKPLTAISNLLGQAVTHDVDSEAVKIVEECELLRLALYVACQAADDMIDHVRAAVSPPEEKTEATTDPASVAISEVDPALSGEGGDLGNDNTPPE